MKLTIQVIPLGPGDPNLLTLQSAEALRNPRFRVILRTGRHPAAAWLSQQGVAFETLDGYYDAYEDFDRMHRAMALFLWEAAEKGPVCLGVMDPGSDGAVAALKASRPEGAFLSVLPGVSSAEACLSSLSEYREDAADPRLISAADTANLTPDPDAPLLIRELDSALLAGEVKLRLMDLYPEDMEVFFFPPSEKNPRPVQRIPLYSLDSRKKYDHTAAVFVPAVNYENRTRYTFHDLERIMTRLRGRDGCPWDRIQTHDSLRPYLVEEAWEAVSAIDDGDTDHLADELGDVLFQVVFHASLGESYDEFTLRDVISAICEKMIRRHPHVFVSGHEETARQIADGWEKSKRTETGSKTVGESLEDVSFGLPALKYAEKSYRKLAQLPALRRDPARIAGEIRQQADTLFAGERFSPEAMTGLLMKCAELCCRTDQDAEILLHQGIVRMKRRFQEAEKEMTARGLNPEDMMEEALCAFPEMEGVSVK